ncbi:unnamed protein product [Blepharisma stoltei]|uniref:Tyrosine-protein kinase ephrin type A/B receptor-like domain-containing protein n=1 Tax=Blepharisma stoltei TaxID=1481888 RepID=A0AAU9I7B4_9CILI|nr:unnamed protein product [Blepharisma stoltei]
MAPKSGYWRDNKYTNVFWKCPNSDACLGSTNPNNISYTGECSGSYKGNMCQSCEYGYSKTGDDTCSPCPDKATNSMRIIGIFIALIILGAIMVKSTRDSAFVPKSLTSVYIKIFMNYLQLVMLVTTINLNWPSLVLQVFSTQNSAGSVSDQVFSFDCFLQTSESDPDQYYFNELILMSLMPIGISLLALVIWVFIDLKRKSFKDFTNDYLPALFCYLSCTRTL